MCLHATGWVQRSRRRSGRHIIKERRNILEILLDGAVVVQILHAGQDGTRDKTKRISLSSSSSGEERSNVPKHCYAISFQEVSALTKTFNEFAADSELESEVVFRHKRFVEFDLQKGNQHVRSQTMARPHGPMVEKRRDIGMV